MKSSYFKWILLTLGSSGYLFSGPVFQIAIAGWLIPLGLFYFIRSSHPWKGYAWSVLFITTFIFISGSVSSALPPIANLISAILSGIIDVIPFLLARFLYPSKKSHLTLWALPVFGVAYDYLISFPLSSIGALGATQSSFLTLIQFSSVLGMFSISFLLYWAAAVVVSKLMDEPNATTSIRQFAFTFIAILVFGMIKREWHNPMEETVKVSGIVLEEKTLYEDLYQDFFNETIAFDLEAGGSPKLDRLFAAIDEFRKDPGNPDYGKVKQSLRNFEDKLVALTEKEAENGAKIIVWSETNLAIFQQEEGRMLERVSEVAKKFEVVIATSTAVLLPYFEGGPMYKNKSVMFLPNGETAQEYEKAKPVPFLDSSLPGDGKLKITNSPFGKLTLAICYDADFPDLIKQSGPADILLLPSNDWLGISPFHGDHAVFRAIENGVSVVRPTGTGQSVIFDYDGQILGRLNAFDHQERILVGHVPIKGRKTLFSLIGNAFAWLCMICSVFLSVVLRKEKTKASS